MKNKIKKVIKNFLKIIRLPEMKVLPGQLAFYILMSIVPMLAICSILASVLLTNFNFVSEIKTILPSALADVLLPLLMNETPNVNIVLLIIFYLILASNGPAAIITTSNEIYKFSHEGFFKVHLKAFIMTVIIVVLLLFMIIVPIFGDIILNFLVELFGISNSINNYIWIYKVLKILISFMFIYFTIKLLYTTANNKIKSSTTTGGAIFTTLGWIIATEIFAFYITNIARYNLLYGNFANILILLIWINLLAYLFVVGMALNLNKYQSLIQKEKEAEVK